MKFICLILYCIPFSAMIGQGLSIDEIKRNLHQPQNDTTKVGLYLKASQYYTFHNLDTALIYADSSYALAKKVSAGDGITNSGLNLAYLYRIRGTYPLAIDILHQTLKALNNETVTTHPLKIYRWLGKNHYESRQYDSALYWTKRTLQEAKMVRNIQQLVYAYSDYANIFYKKYDFDNAVFYYSKADSVCEHHNLNSVSYLSALGRLGKMKFNTDLYRTAHNYLEKVKQRFIDQKNPAGVTEITLSLGMLEFNCDNLEASLPYLFHCLEYYSRLNMTPKEMIVHKTLGQVYLEQNKLQLANKHFFEYFRLSSILDDRHEMSQSQAFLGAAHFKERNYPVAQFHYQQAKHYAQRLNDLNLTYTATQGLANTYLKSFKPEAAAIEFSQIVEMQDSVINLKKNERALAMFAELQVKQKEKKIGLLQSEKALAEQQKRNQRNLLLGGIGLTSVAGIFIFFLYRNRQKTNRKLQEIDHMKSRFFANISHEFRTPLTLISAPIEQKLSNGELTEKERSDLEMMQRNNQRLLELVDQLLDLSQIGAGHLKLKVEKGDPLHFIGAMGDSFNYAAHQRNIDYHYHVDTPGEQVWFDRDALAKIVVNLLSNAIKYTPEEGSVVCKAFLANNVLQVEVKNTGRGLSKEQQKKVFERFYQADQHQPGTGIGLALVHELVSLHKGAVHLESEKDGWTTFRVVLPVDKKSFKESEIHTTPTSIERHKVVNHVKLRGQGNTPISDNDLPILLVVDDHADVRALLKHTFEKGYNILTAKNGAEGVKLAIDRIPDLIISDVMMPVKDGIALARELKNDERTCHIPIVLLTARAGEENEVAGIETGADDYITKPFSTKILTSKVGQLIELRQQLQSRYSQEIILKPKDIAITGVDERFLEKIQAVLDEKLTESNFNTQEFSEAVGMSRMQLHRKLKALTGLTTSEFIRSQRLKLGASLLQNSNANVSQIAYQVGFNDPSYFTKCFKEVYGSSPTEFISN